MPASLSPDSPAPILSPAALADASAIATGGETGGTGGAGRRKVLLALVGVILVGLNLRVGITSAAALFHELQQALGYGAFIASLLPSIPTLCFAFAGLATNPLSRRLGVENTVVFALFLLTCGLAIRGIPNTAALLVGSVVAMSGLAICNVSMPVLIRQDHADRTSLVTGLYTFTMTIGATTAATVSVPLAHALGSPSAGLASWAVVAALGLLGFIPLALGRRKRRNLAPAAAPEQHHSIWAALRGRKAVLIAVVFSAQGFLAYAVMSWFAYILSDSGMDATQSGLMFGVMQFVSMFAGMLFLAFGSRNSTRPWALAIPAACTVAGIILLMVAPVQTALLSAGLTGLGLGIFPLVLAIISQSGGTPAETTALSTAAQSLGYLFSALGPLGIGLLHGLTGQWLLPLGVAVGVAVLLTGAGFMLGRLHRGHGPRVVVATQRAGRDGK